MGFGVRAATLRAVGAAAVTVLMLAGCGQPRSTATAGGTNVETPAPDQQSPGPANSPTAALSRSPTESPSDPPTKVQLPSASPSPTSWPTAAGLTGTVLSIDTEAHLHIQNLADGLVLRTVAAYGPRLISSARGGWVIGFNPDNEQPLGRAPTQLATVSLNGTLTAFGPRYPPETFVTSIAVSPDGARVAVSLMQTALNAPSVASIMVLPLPGHAGAERTWTFASRSYINEVESLSWAPDGKRLSYIPGIETGAGIGGDPSTLDTSLPGTTAPDQTPWKSGQRCDANGASWLPSSTFAIVRDCEPAATFVTVRFSDGAPLSTPMTLPHGGCSTSVFHLSSVDERILITRCQGVELVDGAALTLLPDTIIDAAWPG